MGIMYPRLHGILSREGINLANGLVHLYTFENNANIGEDSIGTLDLTNINGVTQGVGKVGAFSAQFDKTMNQHLSVPFPQSVLSLDSDYTFAMWTIVQNTSDPGAQTAFNVFNTGIAEVDFNVYYYNDTQIGYFWRPNSPAGFLNSQVLVPTEWNHVVAVRRNNVIELYTNAIKGVIFSGSFTDTITDPTTQDNTSELRIGLISSNYITGFADQLAIWNRALSVEEIDGLYNSGSGIPLV